MKPKFWNKGKIYLSKKDKVLKTIINKYPKEHLTLNKNYFHCFINSIIGQQISVAAANSIKYKFFSLKKNIHSKTILNIKESDMKMSGLSKQKIQYIKNVAIFFNNNKEFINNINYYNSNVIKERLIEIKGVGNWTIEMFLMFGLGKQDIFPSGDLGFRKAISILYNEKLPISEKRLIKFYNKWKPYNTIATWYLWRSLDPEVISY